jgi:FKBP-type peptidyl-prolyl cis-trans isomerase
MATPRSQQIGIWVIAVVLLVGTLGSFLVMILSSQNQAKDQAALQKAYTTYQSDLAKQAKQLSDKYYKEFSQYSTTPAIFNSDGIKTLTTNDLKVGSGMTLTDKTEYSAYYIGWNPKGVVFDQSIENGALKAPIVGGNLIPGWNEGVIGMKFGGVREITIPPDKAYGATGSGDNIPPNTPIKFVVMVIPKVTDIQMPQVLKDYYNSQQQ